MIALALGPTTSGLGVGNTRECRWKEGTASVIAVAGEQTLLTFSPTSPTLCEGTPGVGGVGAVGEA